MDFDTERRRIVETYAGRDQKGFANRYAWHLPEAMLVRNSVDTLFATFCRRHWRTDLAEMDVLDIGCGKGGWLRRLVEFGVAPARAHGIDVLPDRIADGLAMNPAVDLQVSDGWTVPFPDASMDLVSAHVVFSSVLDAKAREILAGEMARIVKPGGVVMIFDFRIASPRNRSTIGIPNAEVDRLFPGFHAIRYRLMVAPPIARMLGRLSPGLLSLAEVLAPMLMSHRCHFLRRA